MVWTYSVTGKVHASAGTGNQDRIASWEDERSAAIVLCDGAGSLSRSAEGAQCASEAVLKFLKEAREDLFSFSSAKISLFLTWTVQWALKKKAENDQISFGDMGSTMQALYLDKKHGRVLIAGLGDGGCFFQEGRQHIESVLPPERFPGNQVVLTTSEEAKEHVKVWRGSTNQCMGILCSDGLFVNNMTPASEVEDMLKDRQFDRLAKYMHQAHFCDDASIAVLDWDKKSA